MWTLDSNAPRSARDTTFQRPNSSVAEMPNTRTQVTPSAALSQHSMIGKSIVIKGEIAASDPLYIYGSVEGLINAPAQRVTVGKEAKVKADISAREVVIMGEVRGNLDGGERVEIRGEGSLTGNLATHRVCIEDGAFLKGAIDVRPCNEAEQAEAEHEALAQLELEEADPATELELDRSGWESK